ncbi:hypothetical protein B0H12DRAFT_1239590 [Mycena haematopus]|nr:hypothetical protein B0H12DRAFT_1239590 [Mycena haematopus]
MQIPDALGLATKVAAPGCRLLPDTLVDRCPHLPYFAKPREHRTSKQGYKPPPQPAQVVMNGQFVLMISWRLFRLDITTTTVVTGLPACVYDIACQWTDNDRLVSYSPVPSSEDGEEELEPFPSVGAPPRPVFSPPVPSSEDGENDLPTVGTESDEEMPPLYPMRYDGISDDTAAAREHDDPSFGPGWGYLVEEGGYKEHLRGYVGEDDVSTCIAFVALMQKDTRMTTGLRASGVGGVVCARHELVRPQGLGDLQKGERYSNMDYIFLSSIVGVGILWITISYDIACQWKINLADRMSKLPDHLQMDCAVGLRFGLPVWHAATHEKTCQVQNSLSFMNGVGRTDGEGIERTWAVLNPLGWATKEMGNGARHDAPEDKIDHHNWEKNLGQGDTLARRLVVAIDKRDVQEMAKMVDAWMEDPFQPNPYLPAPGAEGGPTEAAIRLELTKEEGKEAAAGGGKLHGSSVMSFLVAGLQLEESQVRIKREVKGRTLLTTSHEEKVEEMRIGFLAKLRKFRRLQQIYTPAAAIEVDKEEDARDPELPPPSAEDIKLYLPSQLKDSAREAGSQEGLPDRLHCKHHLIDTRNEDAVGQRASTRAATLIASRGAGGCSCSEVQAGASSPGPTEGREYCEGLRFRELSTADVTLDEEREADARARQKLSLLGSNRWRRRHGSALSSKERKLSWIWTSGGGPGEDEAVRVDWAKAQARKQRWEEEVETLRWEVRRSSRGADVRAEVRAGLEAYAARHTAMSRELARRFKTEWDASAKTVLRNAVLHDEALADIMASFSTLTHAPEAEGENVVEKSADDTTGSGSENVVDKAEGTSPSRLGEAAGHREVGVAPGTGAEDAPGTEGEIVVEKRADDAAGRGNDIVLDRGEGTSPSARAGTDTGDAVRSGEAPAGGVGLAAKK